ncbi:RES family NAD+ phosphorylase [Tsukamurella soli]|uniref:RES family NAD+ phosphorylase n=1 Tax=Tsukamurella soli TaxID=644556 RepID=UPI0031EB06EE
MLPPVRTVTLQRGTPVWRIHHGSRRADAPNSTPQPAVGSGGRFDSSDGRYAYLYVADSPEGAVAETLCRDLPIDRSPRLIPAARIRNRVMSELVVQDDLVVADITGSGSAQINAGSWLTHCGPDDYVQTRAWAVRILESDGALRGIRYRPRHDDNRLAWMLCARAGAIVALATSGRVYALDSPQGRTVLAPILAGHNAALR